MRDKAVVAVLATLDTKREAARFICSELERSGVKPYVLDLSLRPSNDDSGLGCNVQRVLPHAMENIALPRGELAKRVVAGGSKLVEEQIAAGHLDGVIGVGGANGSAVACAIMRRLPTAFPKAMVTPVAATAAVQWYVAESDIVMFPTVGDIWLNRITQAVLSNAAAAMAAMATHWRQNKTRPTQQARPLIGLSTFGNLQPAVDTITLELELSGQGVIHFHASGPGGRALEALADRRELAAVLDLTTSELTDHLTGGVYSAGEGRLTAAGRQGLPQVVVPGALDFTNFWAADIPHRYRGRTFYRYNAEIWLMRTSTQEFAELGRLISQKLADSTGPTTVFIPRGGLSGLAGRRASDIEGHDIGPWFDPEGIDAFTRELRAHWSGRIEELPLHINDPDFAHACSAEILSLLRG